MGQQTTVECSIARGMSQQEFLQQAMMVLGMTPDAFAARLGAGSRTLARWLSPPGSKDALPMPDPLWRYIAQMLD